jgi:hypothetical protein
MISLDDQLTHEIGRVNVIYHLVNYLVVIMLLYHYHPIDKQLCDMSNRWEVAVVVTGNLIERSHPAVTMSRINDSLKEVDAIFTINGV